MSEFLNLLRMVWESVTSAWEVVSYALCPCNKRRLQLVELKLVAVTAERDTVLQEYEKLLDLLNAPPWSGAVGANLGPVVLNVLGIGTIETDSSIVDLRSYFSNRDS